MYRQWLDTLVALHYLLVPPNASAHMATHRTIFRVANRHKPYAQLGNAMLRDSRLSFEARGVLAFILTYPSNWQFGLAWLCRNQGIGRDRARRIIKEHVAVGYCQRGRGRNPGKA